MKNSFIKKPKIIVVLGQTATGKSDLAVEISQHFNGEVISADSRQVYKKMDLGSGKITKDEMKGVPHHLLDVAHPKDIFDVTQFQKLGTKAIQDILKRRKTPIICGGTGFYIDALVNDIKFSSVKPNKELRKELEKKSLTELQDLLSNKISKINYLRRKINKNIYRNIDIKNPIRVIRAIEIISKLGYLQKIKRYNNYNVLYIGLTLSKEDLNKRIHKRIISRLKDGMLNEIDILLKDGISHKRLQSFGLEYRFMSKYMLGEIDYDEMIEQIYKTTIQFAKRQRTWFKRNRKVHWFNPINDKKDIFTLIEKFIN